MRVVGRRSGAGAAQERRSDLRSPHPPCRALHHARRPGQTLVRSAALRPIYGPRGPRCANGLSAAAPCGAHPCARGAVPRGQRVRREEGHRGRPSHPQAPGRREESRAGRRRPGGAPPRQVPEGGAGRVRQLGVRSARDVQGRRGGRGALEGPRAPVSFGVDAACVAEQLARRLVLAPLQRGQTRASIRTNVTWGRSPSGRHAAKDETPCATCQGRAGRAAVGARVGARGARRSREG